MKTKSFRIPAVVLFLCTGLMIYQSCRKSDNFTSTAAHASSESNVTAALDKKPNIILILADDVGYGIPTANGGRTFQTPNLDSLANSGMRFTNCYSAPLCSPSRTMFMTGKYNFRNYVNWGVLDLNQKMMSNVLHDAGYATYTAGKWEFDGGDVSIKAHGFDGYSVWNAFVQDNGSHYKTPRIYENGGYLPNSVVANKYGDDIFTDRVMSFVKQNKDNNFFVYFPITLCHYPYSPTPDDPEFATWNDKTSIPDTAYFPNMVKYMDKKIGQLMDSLREWNLFRNTIVMFVGDNGTPHHIWFDQDGVYQEGGKSTSTAIGTHVPLIVSWPAGGITGGQVNDNLIDFTDFTPTVIEAAGATIPADYGTTDGVSFLNQLKGLPTVPRSWIFCHYAPNTNNGNTIVKRWINTTTYKLYDSTGRFYNIALDPEEKHPILKSAMTPEEKTLRKKLQATMNTLH